MKIKKKKIQKMILQVDDIITAAEKMEKKYKKQIISVHPDHKLNALNLVHYLALRSFDIRELQDQLGQLGISRLGKAEGHVMASLYAVRTLLYGLIKSAKPDSVKTKVSFKKGHKNLRKTTNALFGKKMRGSRIRIMVTMPSEAADDPRLINSLVGAGMNAARINLAHDGSDEWRRMTEFIKKAKKSKGRNCKICTDLGGPKLRTGSMVQGPKVIHISPERDNLGAVTGPGLVWLAAPGTEPPMEETLFIPVKDEWVRMLKKGDTISFTDTRGKDRTMIIDMKKKNGRYAKCFDSAYIQTGTTLTIDRLKEEESASVEVDEMLPLEEKIVLKPGDALLLHKDPRPGEPAKYDESGNLIQEAHISCTLPEVFSDVKPGEPIILDDGKIEGVIKDVEPELIKVEVTYAKNDMAKLKADKGINLPESDLSVSGLTDKDKEDLKFAVKHADIINVSFVNSKKDIAELLKELKKHEAEPGLVLKIETQKGFRNLPEILLEAMKTYPIGVMIARGDLAIECGWQNLAQIQEEILWLCEAAHIPIVWATQVLETLAKKGRPSRAEITDAAMAEQAECVMLNKGPHIIETIRMLDTILSSGEAYHKKKAPMLPKLKMVVPEE